MSAQSSKAPRNPGSGFDLEAVEASVFVGHGTSLPPAGAVRRSLRKRPSRVSSRRPPDVPILSRRRGRWGSGPPFPPPGRSRELPDGVDGKNHP